MLRDDPLADRRVSIGCMDARFASTAAGVGLQAFAAGETRAKPRGSWRCASCLSPVSMDKTIETGEGRGCEVEVVFSRHPVLRDVPQELGESRDGERRVRAGVGSMAEKPSRSFSDPLRALHATPRGGANR